MRYALPLLLLLALGQAFAQSGLPPHYHCVTSGVNNGLMHPSVSTKLLFIYNQSEIAAMTAPVTGPVSISRIYFRTNNAGTANYTGLSIRMGHTSLSNAATSTTFATNFNVGSPVTVYSGPASFVMSGSNLGCGTASTWFYLDLTTPFSYNFTNNLCVELSYASQSGAIPSYYALNPGGGANPTAITALSSAAATGSINSRPMFGISAGVVLEGGSLGLHLVPNASGPVLSWDESGSGYGNMRLLVNGPNGLHTTEEVDAKGEMRMAMPIAGAYRAHLEAQDADGQLHRSAEVNWLQRGEVKVHSLPWTDELRITLPEPGCRLTLLDVKGAVMMEEPAAGLDHIWQKALPPGTYYLRIVLPDGSTTSRKLLHL